MQVYRLYCGRNIPASTQTVSEREFQDFLKTQSLFDGLTIWKAEGFWKGELEETFIIEIATVDIEKVYLLAKLYKLRFWQESVLVIETTDSPEFI
jgi:hypothetical protein